MNDNVNKPAHYTTGTIETIDFIEDKQLGFHLGNVIKYIVRAGKKDPSKEVEDLEKAAWYLNRAITLKKSTTEPKIGQTWTNKAENVNIYITKIDSANEILNGHYLDRKGYFNPDEDPLLFSIPHFKEKFEYLK